MNFSSNEDDLEEMSAEWKVRRIKCLTVFVVQLFALAVDSSIVSTLEPAYLKFAIKDSANYTTYAALLTTSYGLAAIIFQLILGGNADKTRRIKRLLVLCNSCSALGNCIYSIPHGILVLMIGKFIRGIGASAYVIVIGEVARSYLPQDLRRAVAMCLTGTILGELLGPVAAGSFLKVSFDAASLRIRHENALTLATSAFFLVVLVLTVILASDLSASFDLKASYYELAANRCDNEGRLALKEDDLVESAMEDESAMLFGRRPSIEDPGRISNESVFKVLQQLLGNVVTLTIMFASFVFAHYTLLLREYAIMTSRRKTKIDSRYSSVITTLSVLTRGATFLAVGSLGEKVSDISLVYAGFAFAILSGACWLIVEYMTTDDSAMLSLFVISLAAVCLSSCGEISLQVLIAKLVPSSIQSSSEAFRLGFMTLGGSMAELIHAAEISVPLVSGTVLTGLNVVTIAVVNMNYQYLADPKPLIKIASRKYY